MNPTSVQPNVLIVDDEEPILRAFRRLLRGQPYRLLLASSGRDALAIAASESINIVITDQRMPDISGIELLRKIHDLSPATVGVILSGYADKQLMDDAVASGDVHRFFSKPWPDQEMKAFIAESCGLSLTDVENDGDC